MTRLLLAGIFLATAPDGCEPPPSPPIVQLEVPSPVEVVGNRIRVTKIATFSDTTAYDNERAIYIIHDAETGKEFVGISGIGISELGSHTSGDDRVKDER